jgi:hypothetical protein
VPHLAEALVLEEQLWLRHPSAHAPVRRPLAVAGDPEAQDRALVAHDRSTVPVVLPNPPPDFVVYQALVIRSPVIDSPRWASTSMSGDRRSVANTIITSSARSGDGTLAHLFLRLDPNAALGIGTTTRAASGGRPRCPSRLRRTGLESVGGLLPRRERLEDKVGAARPLIVEERRALQLIALGNRVVLEDVASATQHQRCCASPRRHHKSMSARCVPLPAPHLRMSWTRSRETGQLPRC